MLLPQFSRLGEAGKEPATEILQEIIANAGAKVGWDPERNLEQGTAEALYGQVGERQPQAVHLQGSRWSYSLDSLPEQHLLFGIYPSQTLPAIVRVCAQKTCAALESMLGSVD